MDHNQQGWSIVVVGEWNTRIFSPGWVCDKVFRTKEVRVEVAVEAGPLRFSAQNLNLVVTSDRLAIGFETIQDRALGYSEELLERVLQLLPHTPVRAVGLNLAYCEHANSEELVARTRDPESARLYTLGFPSESHEVVRHFSRGLWTLNFTVGTQPERIDFGFNFHRETKSATEAAAALTKGSYLTCREEALELLRGLYGLEVVHA